MKSEKGVSPKPISSVVVERPQSQAACIACPIGLPLAINSMLEAGTKQVSEQVHEASNRTKVKVNP